MEQGSLERLAFKRRTEVRKVLTVGLGRWWGKTLLWWIIYQGKIKQPCLHSAAFTPLMQRPNKSLTSVGRATILAISIITNENSWFHITLLLESKIPCKLIALYHGHFVTSWIGWCVNLALFLSQSLLALTCAQTTHMYTHAHTLPSPCLQTHYWSLWASIMRYASSYS